MLELNSKMKQQPNLLPAGKLTNSKGEWLIEWEGHITSVLLSPISNPVMNRASNNPKWRAFCKIPDQTPPNNQGHKNEGSLRSCHRPEKSKDTRGLNVMRSLGWDPGTEKRTLVETLVTSESRSLVSSNVPMRVSELWQCAAVMQDVSKWADWLRDAFQLSCTLTLFLPTTFL